jgi:hypothetical protein
MILFLERFDKDSLLHRDEKRTEHGWKILPLSDFISDEDWLADFQMTLTTTRE